MSVRNLDRIFRPRRIAVVGASNNPGRVGNTVLRNLLQSGFGGVVYPINPKHESVLGIQAYASVGDVPRAPDLAIVCTPGPTVPGLVRECGEMGARGLVVLSAGFREVGAEGRALEAAVLEEAGRFEDLRIIGPNCVGIVVPGMSLNASFAAGMPKPGRIAFFSQSGALCTSVLDWALDENVGFSCFVSVGNTLDVDFADLIDYVSDDPETDAVILYVESIGDARKFMSAARAFTRTKPIVVYKAGRFDESAAAAASHTGAMAGADDVYEAAFERAGIVRVTEMADMFDCASLLARERPPSGDRLGIVTNAGGLGVMATDALMGRKGVLATLGERTMESLNAILPPCWSHANPIDVIGDAPAERIAGAAELALGDPSVDALLVILCPQAITDPTRTAHAVAEVAGRAHKPVLTAWVGGRLMKPGRRVLSEAGVPSYETAEQAVDAFMHLIAYARNIEVLYETPRQVPLGTPPDRGRIRGILREGADAGGEAIAEHRSKEIVETYGIPTARAEACASADDAVRTAERVGYPVVMKIHSPQITHKTDVGGIALDLPDEASVRAAFDRIVNRAREACPEATIDGVTIQPMVRMRDSVELIVGAKRDPTFGSAILVGMGGVTAEMMGDRAVGLPPLNERLARRMLESLSSWPLLTGFRGRAPVDVDALVEVLIRFSYLIADHPEISEIDLNPLVVSPEGVVALDARIIPDRAALERTPSPYSHLAIRPYPAEYERRIDLPDGTPVLLRPIRPEDEPAWHEMLSRCSPESLRMRFLSTFKRTTHKMAARYCFVDYDREMAIVAEVEEEGEKKLVGVGRLVTERDAKSAEYAVLVIDSWQGRHLGTMLTEYCIGIAMERGIRRVVGVTTPQNARMIEVFRRLGFHLSHEREKGVVLCEAPMEAVGGG